METALEPVLRSAVEHYDDTGPANGDKGLIAHAEWIGKWRRIDVQVYHSSNLCVTAEKHFVSIHADDRPGEEIELNLWLTPEDVRGLRDALARAIADAERLGILPR